MHCRTLALCVCILICSSQRASAQSTISGVSPKSCPPGQTTRLTLTGQNLKGVLRITSSIPSAEISVESVEAEKAQIELKLPTDAPYGPLGLWIATDDGPASPLVLFVDDLPPVIDNAANHSRDSAQEVPALCAIAGLSDGPQSDFYRFKVEAGQRVAIEVLTQAVRSGMDPVLKLLDANGKLLHIADDEMVGPECRLSYTFTKAGDYWLEINDSHFAAGGAYYLRIGDFPDIRHAAPLAVRRGESTRVTFAGDHGDAAEATQVTPPADSSASTTTAAARLSGGRSAAWATVLVRDSPQFVEPRAAEQESQTAAQPLAAPIGISGRLDQPRERDRYPLKGVKGQTIRVASRTRSLGCSTLLHMQLLDAAGAKLVETAITEADEWSFDFTFPDDAIYQLEVRDLLHRGGPAFGYWIDIQPAGSFSVALKADAATKELFALEPEVGCGAVDLQISRFGYDGALMLSLSDPASPLRIVNPLIAAGATEARVYVAASERWIPESLALLRIVAHATDNPAMMSSTGSTNLRRVKEPHVPFPAGWDDGTLLFAGVPKGEAFFAFEPAAEILFARPVRSHAATLNLKRLKPEFKAGATLLGQTLPAGWAFDSKAEQDAYGVTFTRSTDVAGEPTTLPLLAFAEHNSRARLETIPVSVAWIDPLQVSLKAPEKLVPGQSAKLHVSVTRTGEPQPVTLKLTGLPAGLSGPAEPITVAADQSAIDIELQVALEIASSEPVVIGVEAASKHGGQDFTVAAHSAPVKVLAPPSRLEIFPLQVMLDGLRSRQQLVITGFNAADSPRDWSREVRITSENQAIAKVDGTVVHPIAAGETTIVVELGSTRIAVPVKVTIPEAPQPIAFESEVLVALSKQGCNSGACHGSPSGKGGFRLSLRAFDKQLDELTLIREDFGRRVNPLDPERSLLLVKPMMKVPHGGGMQLHPQDEAYAILREWISSGARPDPADKPRCVRLEVYPPTKRVADLAAGGQQIAATAHFSDGSQRDVTPLVAYESSNTEVATIDVHGRVTPLARGETVILVRFLEHIESVPLMFVEDVDGFHWPEPPVNNFIDSLVDEKLRQLRYQPATICSDDVFLRRVFLDVIGGLPTVEETIEFLADASPEKRSRLIDRLLERDEYARFWALKWGDLLRMTAKTVGNEGVYKYHRWVEHSIRTNMPYDEFASALLTGSGSTLADPPANFYRTATDMNDCVETVSQVFLGARLQCAKCHNHPFERWTQDNYYGLGAFFQRVQRRNTQRPGEMFVYSAETGEVTQPRTGRVMQPWLPQVGEITVPADEDRRETFARWLVDPANVYFAKVEANRIWSQLFARGIVDPIDDFRDSNPPTNERLLEALAKDFADSGFDRKHLLRTILNSRTYQADYQTNAFNDETLYFSHQEPRLLSAEQLLDALNQAVGLTQSFGGLPAGTKATQLPAPDLVKVDFLKVFGQPERSTVCACERADDSNLGMAIELFNGALIHEKLRDANNRFRKAVAAGKPTSEVIREMYLAAVCRPPTETELTTALAHCERREDVASGLEDVCWALFNTDEFLFQH